MESKKLNNIILYTHFAAWLLILPFELANKLTLGISIALIAAGIISYIAVYFNVRTLWPNTWRETRIIKSIFGNNYDRLSNLLLGSIELLIGLIAIKNVW